MFLFKALAVLLAQVHDRLHVHFIEGGQDGSRRLRLHQTLGHAGTQARHRHTLLGTTTQQLLGVDRCCRLGQRLCSRRRGSRTKYIRLSHTTIATGAADGGGVLALLGGDLARRRHHCRRGTGSAGSNRCSRLCRSGGSSDRGNCSALAFGINLGDHFA